MIRKAFFFLTIFFINQGIALCSCQDLSEEGYENLLIKSECLLQSCQAPGIEVKTKRRCFEMLDKVVAELTGQARIIAERPTRHCNEEATVQEGSSPPSFKCDKFLDSEEDASQQDKQKLITYINNNFNQPKKRFSIRRRKKFNFPVYLSPEETKLKWPLMAFADGRIFVLFDDEDHQLGKGTYKRVTQAFSCESGEMMAHLSINLTDDEDRIENYQELISAARFAKDGLPHFSAHLTHGADILQRMEIIQKKYGCTLDDWRPRKGDNEYSDLFQVFYDSARQLNSIHKKDYFHRDIKPGNILCEGQHAYLADLGMLTHKDSSSMALSAGSPSFLPLEVYDENGLNFAGKSAGAIDVYSLGMTMDYIINGRSQRYHSMSLAMRKLYQLYKEKKLSAAILEEKKKEFQSEYEKSSPEGLMDDEFNPLEILVHRMINPNPAARPTMKEVVKKLQEIGHRDRAF